MAQPPIRSDRPGRQQAALSRVANLSPTVILVVLTALVVAIGLLLVQSSFAQRTARQTANAEADAAIALETVEQTLPDAETGQRGFLLTQDPTYLQPYDAGLAAFNTSIQQLRAYFADDPFSLVSVAEIERNARKRLAEMATVLALFDQGKHEQWQVILMSDVGRQTMDAMRTEAAALLKAESDRIASQRQNVVDTLRVSRLGVNIMTALALAALLLFLRKTQMLDSAQFEHARALRAERDLLEGQVSLRTADLTELARHLEVAREDERSRLARELHDELGALLTAAKLDAARLKRQLLPMSAAAEEGLKHLHATLDQGIALKRNIIENLRPSSLSNLGLVAALEIQAKEFATRTDIRVRTRLEHVALSDGAQITIYRMVQESFTNIAKYARANDVLVSLSATDGGADTGRVHISVVDNGVGFDPAHTARSAHGLSGMRYRVEGQGGGMQVSSAPGKGTTISAWLPSPTENQLPQAAAAATP